MVSILLLGVISLLLIDIVIDIISAQMNYRALSINTLCLPKLPKAGIAGRKAMIASASKRPLYLSNAKNKGKI